MRQILKDSTDQSVTIRIVDATDGTPEQAVEHDTAGIALWYRREGGLKVAITPAALSALDEAHSDGGIEHIDDGYYRLDVADAAFATGSNGVLVGGAVTGMVVIACYAPLVDFNPQDAVRLGLTALPNAAADGAGGLPISDAGGLDLDAKIGALTFTVANKVDANVTHAAGTAWGSGAITAGAIATGAITSAKFAAGAIDAAAIANGAIDAATFAADVDAEILSYLVDDATRIDASALNTAATAVGSNGSGLTEAGGTGDQFTAIPNVGINWSNITNPTATVNLSGTTIKTATDIAADIAALPTVSSIWTTALTEAYPTDGSTGTGAQLLYLLLSVCSQFDITSTTLTARKLDGTTQAATYLLDSAVSPTSRVRAS